MSPLPSDVHIAVITCQSLPTLIQLTEMVKKLPKLDWTQRESVRADLRRHVRQLLAK